MKVYFRNKKLELIFSEEAHKTKLPVAVIKSARAKIIFISNAKTEEDLINWRSLNYETLLGKKSGFRSIRLNKQWRLVFELIETADAIEVHLSSIEDYH